MDKEEKSLLAAELALGVLDAAERRGIDPSLAVDAEFRRELALWQARLAAVADIEEARPSGRVFDRTYRELFDRPPKRRFWARHLWAEIRAPEHRRLVATTLAVKGALIASFLLWLL